MMDANEPLSRDATLRFEKRLESLLLESFSNGAVVEGIWEIGDPTDAIPTWTIEVVKSAEADTMYDPEFIE